MIKLFIVDDHEIIREGLKQLLEVETDFEVVGIAQSGDEMLQNLDNVNCDIVLLDLSMPGQNGFDVIAQLKKKKPKLKILVFTISPENRFAIKAYKAGAAGYICKDASVVEIISAVRSIYTTGRYMNPIFAEQLAFDLIKADNSPQTILSKLEISLVLMADEGLDMKEIAKKLGLSLKATLTTKNEIFEKLRINNYLELMHYVKDNKLAKS
jgi:DNA-binding NarL/FixJ family response regulator